MSGDVTPESLRKLADDYKRLDDVLSVRASLRAAADALAERHVDLWLRGRVKAIREEGKAHD